MSTGSPPLSQERLMELRGYVTPRRAAALAGRHVVTVYNWMTDGKVSWTKVGRRRYIKRSSLARYLHPLLLAPPPPQPADPT